MADNPANPFPGATGLIVQLVPSQCSMRFVNPSPLVSRVCPQAQTLLLETAATPSSRFALPAGPVFGLGTIFQAFPSQCSVRVFCTAPAALDVKFPTAQTSFVAIAVTPLPNSTSCTFPLDGTGTGTMRHF